MKRALPPLFLLSIATLAGAADSVSWKEADACVGRVCSVSGVVTAVETEEGAIRLFFDGERKVSVTLVRSWLVSWPDYAGRSIIANGPVRRFRELTEVSIRNPSEIVMADGAPTPGIGFEAPEKQEVQDLRREIDRLEQRVKELESR